MGVKSWQLTLLPLAIAAVAVAATWKAKRDFAPDSGNYTLDYEVPTGWVERELRPMVLFQFANEDGTMLLAGGVTNVDAKAGPAEQKPADHIADELVASMRSRLAGWTVQRLPDILTKSEEFSIIWRTNGERSIYTAIGVKGNATAIITLTCTDKRDHSEHPHYGWLEDYLQSVRFLPIRDAQR